MLPDKMTMGGKTFELDKDSWPAFRDANDDTVKRMWMEQLNEAAWLAELLLKMRMGILVSEKPTFITTDNPVTVLNTDLKFKGLRDPEALLMFPLSPTRLLFMDNRHSEPDGKFYEAADHASTNSLLWRNAIEFMFSHRDPHEVCFEISESAARMGY